MHNVERNADEGLLRTLVQNMVHGWNQGDGRAFAAPFAEDADYIVVNGRYLNGRSEIGYGHQQIFETFYRGSQLQAEVKAIRFLSPDIALIRLHCRLLIQGSDATTKEEPTIPTIVARKQATGWSFASFQNTRIEQGSV